MHQKLKNQFILFAGLLATISMVSCEPAVTFSEPQPIDTKNISSIPSKMRGTYISQHDSSTLIISSTIIRRVFDLNVVSDNNKFDSTSTITINRGDSTTRTHHFSFSKDKKGSTIAVHYSDTLFNMDTDILKRYKGYYFLNSKRTNGTWVVNKANTQRKKLIISSISKEEDFRNLQEITKDSSAAPHTFSTSKQEFKQFIKKGGFEKDEIFVKI
ncbi:MAG: hypothetical protein COA58_12395 [Bacteroidetes bacterium]|nr:MAG: hypothetical protein COA58_12395 [Bacteroidota bacterium]